MIKTLFKIALIAILSITTMQAHAMIEDVVLFFDEGKIINKEDQLHLVCFQNEQFKEINIDEEKCKSGEEAESFYDFMNAMGGNEISYSASKALDFTVIRVRGHHESIRALKENIKQDEAVTREPREISEWKHSTFRTRHASTYTKYIMGIEGKKYVCVSGKIRKKIKDGFCVESARTWESHPFVEQGAYYRDLFGPLVEYNYVATLGRDITQKLKYEFKHKRKETSAGNSGDISLNNIEFPEPVQWVIDNHPKSTFGIAVSLILIQLGLFLLGIHLKRKEEGAGQQKKGNRINYKKRKA